MQQGSDPVAWASLIIISGILGLDRGESRHWPPTP
jgi:hypothetical protein